MMRLCATCLLAAAVSVSTVSAQQQQKRQLKDLFELQWMFRTRGEPVEETGEPGRVTFAAAAPAFFTSNAPQEPGGGQSDFYFGPWVLAEWARQFADGPRFHIGASFTDYFYLRHPNLNYAYAEVYTGLSRIWLQSESASLSAYCGLAYDYDLKSDYTTDDFEPSASAGLVLDLDAGRGHSFYCTPDLTLLQALPETSAANSYLAATLTAGWRWQVIHALRFGAYWKGSLSRYPYGTVENDLTQYIGAEIEWQITRTLALALTCIQTINWSSQPSSQYDDLTAGLALRTSVP